MARPPGRGPRGAGPLWRPDGLCCSFLSLFRLVSVLSTRSASLDLESKKFPEGRVHRAITALPSLPGQGCDVNKRRCAHLREARIEAGLTDGLRRNVLNVYLPQSTSHARLE
ncbi:hypothetical protein DmGdi_28870 [Gluconobacter sp. Gdi]|nr:hypothetical protein DmGdi_28870 [Gluconobacter sp. Gdi]